jgi:hypothetical protein
LSPPPLPLPPLLSLLPHSAVTNIAIANASVVAFLAATAAATGSGITNRLSTQVTHVDILF